MDDFTVDSWEDAFPKARVALLLKHFSALSDDHDGVDGGKCGMQLIPAMGGTCNRDCFALGSP